MMESSPAVRSESPAPALKRFVGLTLLLAGVMGALALAAPALRGAWSVQGAVDALAVGGGALLFVGALILSGGGKLHHKDPVFHTYRNATLRDAVRHFDAAFLMGIRLMLAGALLCAVPVAVYLL